MSLVDLRSLPLSIVPLIHWGERQNLLAEGLRSAAEIHDSMDTGRTATP